MTKSDGKAWLDALCRYRYQVNLAEFSTKDRFGREWFRLDLNRGDREQTMMFENHFRNRAQKHLEAWYEVVYWKMFSQRGRANYRTSQIIERIRAQRVEASDLWAGCAHFVRNPSKESFETLQEMLVRSKAMAIVATFPAFMNPDLFPMVDSRVIRWVKTFVKKYPQEANTDDALTSYTGVTSTITTYEWDFYWRWINWCQKSSHILNNCTGTKWRARDVEMAVFQNWADLKNGIRFLPPIR